MISQLTQAATSLQTGEGIMSSLTGALGAIPGGDQLIPGLTDALAMASKGQKLVTDLTEASSVLDFLNAGNFAFGEIGDNTKIGGALNAVNGIVSATKSDFTFDPTQVVNIFEGTQIASGAGSLLTGEAGVRDFLIQEVGHTLSSSFTDKATGLLLDGFKPGAAQAQLETANTLKQKNVGEFVGIVNGL